MNSSRAGAGRRFRVHHALGYGVWSGLIVNLMLIPLFWLAQIRPLALFSLGSVVLFLFCLGFLRRRRVGLVAALTFAEIVVVSIADRLRQAVRASDLVARWGGEEFLMIMPGNAAEAGAEAAERIRLAVAESPVPTSVGELPVTLTIGVAVRLPGESLSGWVNRADLALYAAKRAGRRLSG